MNKLLQSLGMLALVVGASAAIVIWKKVTDPDHKPIEIKDWYEKLK